MIPALTAFAVIPLRRSGSQDRWLPNRLRDRSEGGRDPLIFAITTLGVYGVVIAGWASNNKYLLLGAPRCAAQMVSYEILLGAAIMRRSDRLAIAQPGRYRGEAAGALLGFHPRI